MAEIPDLSKLNGNKPPEPEPATGPLQAHTAFLVVVGADGNIQVSTDTGQTVEVAKVCTTDDIFTACGLIQKDIQVQQTAALVQNGLLQMGSLMQQQQADQAIRHRLNLK
jgi:hypothetical protein